MNKAMRLLSLFVLLALVLCSLTSCGERYRLRESSKEEAATVFTIGEDAVAFEVLYAFFFSQCAEIEGDIASYFSGSEGEARFHEVLSLAVEDICELYALFARCREVGIDPYSEEVERTVLEHLKTNVEGGLIGEYWVRGFESFDAYLAHIRDTYHMTDAVGRLMLRYAICEELLIDYYENRYPVTDADVSTFFYSEDCIRVVWVGRAANAMGLDRAANYEQMEIARGKLLVGDVQGAIQHSTSPTTAFYMGRYTKDAAYYDELIANAYALEIGEVSPIFDLGSEGYFVVKRLAKASSDLDMLFEEIREVYLFEMQYRSIHEIAERARQSIVYETRYAELTFSDFVS